MISPAMVLPDTVPSVHTNCDLFAPTHDKLLPCIEGDSAESADFDTYTTDFDTEVIYSLRKISKRDDAGVGKLPERGIASVSELPKRLNDQKSWKRLHDVLAAESAELTTDERKRRYNQVTALGNSCPVTEMQERLEVKHVVSTQ